MTAHTMETRGTSPPHDVVKREKAEQKIDLNNLERKAWQSRFEDGLWDIMFGVMVMGLGLRLLTDSVWSYVLVLGAAVIWPVGRRYITTSRIGRATFGKFRVRRQTMAVLGTVAAAVIVGFFLIVVRPALDLSQAETGLALGVLVALILSFCGYLIDFPRLYMYGILLGMSMGLTEALGDSVGSAALLGLGCVSLLMGLVLLVRFVQKYPEQDIS
ncbi:MAG: hypothetical protein HXS41_00140 [Theionarchaea archaeon]|nr:hypothetical protein [Theionarchaea archaeon]MBU7019439.1 hypothetical protein [Theionarchaea archaeon]MBU7034837.1 hypothetical protein [Theionarchaea archaeon]